MKSPLLRSYPVPGGEPAGFALWRAREEQGLAREEAAARLALAPARIAAMEEGRWAALPQSGMRAGFVRSYAEFLGLDPDPLLARVEAEIAAAHRSARMGQRAGGAGSAAGSAAGGVGRARGPGAAPVAVPGGGLRGPQSGTPRGRTHGPLAPLAPLAALMAALPAAFAGLARALEGPEVRRRRALAPERVPSAPGRKHLLLALLLFVLLALLAERSQPDPLPTAPAAPPVPAAPEAGGGQ